MTKKAKTSKKLGCPTKYKPEYCEQIIKFFEVEYDYVTEEVASQGRAVSVTRVKLSKFPTLEGFCVDLGITKKTLLNWKDKHTDFLRAYEIAKYKQKVILLQGGLSGDYNSAFAKFVAINCTDMIDKQEVKQEIEGEVKGYGLAFDLTKKPDEL